MLESLRRRLWKMAMRSKRAASASRREANRVRWTTRRVPYMAGSLPLSFVPREMEFEALKAKLLAEDASGPVALTAALQGAGGYGKTTLANALCRDDDVRAEFSDGIVLIEIGKERPDAEVLSLVVDVIETLDSDGRRPGFENPDVAAEQLAAAIGGARLLLVIDDVRREAQLRPFLRGGPNCVRLVTAPAGATRCRRTPRRSTWTRCRARRPSRHSPGACRSRAIPPPQPRSACWRGGSNTGRR